MKEQWIASESLDTLLAEIADGNKTLVAGGTDLLIQMREMNSEEKPSEIADLTGIESLKRIDVDEDMLVLGAAVTYTDLFNSKLVQERLPILAQAAIEVGTPQVRNRGTIGGSLANASPAADMAPVWVLLGAEVVLQKQGAKRVMPVAEFLTGNMTTALAPGEMITEVRCSPVEGACTHFIKVGRRNAAAIARLNGAALLTADASGIKEIRLVIGAATPTPLDLSDACQILKEENSLAQLQNISKETLRRVEAISGRRASAAWKFPALENLTRRLLVEVLEKGGRNIERM